MVLQGAEPEGLLGVGPTAFEDSVLVPAQSSVSLWNSLCVCVCGKNIEDLLSAIFKYIVQYCSHYTVY